MQESALKLAFVNRFRAEIVEVGRHPSLLKQPLYLDLDALRKSLKLFVLAHSCQLVHPHRIFGQADHLIAFNQVAQIDYLFASLQMFEDVLVSLVLPVVEDGQAGGAGLFVIRQ